MAYAKVKKLRAVFYARVSTEEEKQLNALEKQIQENIDVIKGKGWDLVDQYIDEGKSGTTTKRRDEYRRLLDDLDTDKFDVIVVKSQDRLNRNTRDWYIFADKLIKSGKRLYLYMDNKFYIPAEDALITGIKAILAEEYSRDLSKKLNNANQRRIEKAKNGEPVSAMGNGQTYGYRIVDGKWVIDREQAETVRKMYELYIELHSLRNVRNALNELGYRNQKGRLFTTEVIGRVLKNAMHKGWVILNRWHRDFDTKEIIEKPEEEWVIVKDDHEPIVSEEIWDAVNNEMLSHRNIGHERARGKRRGTDILSGKIFCKHCGKVLWKHESNGYINWYCSGKMGRGELACTEPATITTVTIRKYLVNLADEYLDHSAIEYSKTLLKRRSIQWLEDLKARLSTPNNNAKLQGEVERLEKRKSNLIDLYTDGLISKEEFKSKSNEIEAKIAQQRALIIPVEENDDIKEIEDTIANIDREIDLLFANEAELEENKVKFLSEHVEKIIVSQNKDVLIILDRLAGAFLFSQKGKLRTEIVQIEETGGSAEDDTEDDLQTNLLPFDRESVYFTEQTVKDNKVTIAVAI